MNTQAVGLRAYLPTQPGVAQTDGPPVSHDLLKAVKPAEAQARSEGQEPVRPGTSIGQDPRGRHLDLLA